MSTLGSSWHVRLFRALLWIYPRWFRAAHDEILSRHESVEAYLVEGLGCARDDLEKLRDDLLE